MSRTVLHALASYWRRNPLQLLALLVGLMMATALFSGVQALNAQARSSYASAANALGGAILPTLRTADGVQFSDTAFGALRRAGWAVSPLLEGAIEIEGQSLRVVGIDPLSLPSNAGLYDDSAAAGSGSETGAAGMAGFLAAPGIALLTAQTLRALDLEEGDRAQTASGRETPPLAIGAGIAPDTLIMDIGFAQQLLGQSGMISRLIVDPSQPMPQSDPAAITGIPITLNQPDEAADLARLTDSFHLNLTAFGLLSFLVGLFIVYSAISLAFQQRMPMFRTLRACGVSSRGLTLMLLIELMAFALIAGAIGVAIGYVIAARLLPNIAGSLRGLYGAEVSQSLSIEPIWWLFGLGLAVVGALAAGAVSLWRAYRMPPLASAQRIAWEQSQRVWLVRQAIVAICLLASVPLFVRYGEGLISGFGAMAGLLLGGALLLPPVLGIVLRWAAGRSKRPLTEWFWADSRQQLSGLSMALMALLLALSANIGVGTMVDGFRETFTGWLDKRLASEIYTHPSNETEGDAIMRWLAERPEISESMAQRNTEITLFGQPVSILGLADAQTHRAWPLIAAEPEAWAAMARGEGVFVSEQLAQREDLSLSDTLALPSSALPAARIVGIYPDYGNPKGQIIVSIDRIEDAFGTAPYFGIRARAAPENVEAVIAALREDLALGERVVDQSFIKAFSNRIFEQTFAVTGALSVLTMVVAGIAMFMSLVTLAEMRLPLLAPLWSSGVTLRNLAGLELGKSVALAALTSVLAIPLGLAVAWLLVAVVNVQAFGWRLPLHLFPAQWVWLVALALGTAALAACIPVLRLSRMAPARLVKVYADAR